MPTCRATCWAKQIGKTILIDRDAAGYGWFIDPTPQDDAEFTPLAADVLAARPQTAAAGHADLLTAVMHEMGHVLGYGHDAGDARDRRIGFSAATEPAARNSAGTPCQSPGSTFFGLCSMRSSLPRHGHRAAQDSIASADSVWIGG